jgi:hypothetical protein
MSTVWQTCWCEHVVCLTFCKSDTDSGIVSIAEGSSFFLYKCLINHKYLNRSNLCGSRFNFRVISITVIAVFTSVVSRTEVIHTGMTGTITVKAVVSVVMITIRVTATPKADLQRLRIGSSSLLRLRLRVAKMTETGIVIVMLGPGEALAVFVANVTLIMIRYDEPSRFPTPSSFQNRGQNGYGARCDCLSLLQAH